MRVLFSVLFCLVCSIFCLSQHQHSLFIETENFDDNGGWIIDQQSMDVMGSPYLMAHGMGVLVDDASTKITFPAKGEYYVFVRTRNWTSQWSDKAAGKFRVLLNGHPLNEIFGAKSHDWTWVNGGVIKVDHLIATLSLQDLTGFNGRCDAIYFTQSKSDVPPNNIDELDDFRARLMGLNKTPLESEFDFVIIGGGMAGTCAAFLQQD